MTPLLIVQESGRENVALMRRGLGRCAGAIVLGIEATAFWSTAGLDAVFLTLPQAEAWGSKPLPPHTCEVLRTREAELRKGYPPYVVTGVVTRDSDPKTGRFTLPLVVRSALKAAMDFNEHHDGQIKTLGLAQVERFAMELGPEEAGELIGSACQVSPR